MESDYIAFGVGFQPVFFPQQMGLSIRDVLPTSVKDMHTNISQYSRT